MDPQTISPTNSEETGTTSHQHIFKMKPKTGKNHNQHQSHAIKAEFEMNGKLIKQKADAVAQELSSTLKARSDVLIAIGRPLESASAKSLEVAVKTFIAFLLNCVGILMIHNALTPMFYGRPWLAILFSVGIGLLIFATLDVLFIHFEKNSSAKTFEIVNFLMAVLIMGFLVGGFYQLHKSRSLTMMIEAAQHLIGQQDQAGIQKIINAKQRLSQLHQSAFVLLFLGLEYICGACFYLYSKELIVFWPIIKLNKRIKSLKKSNARLQEKLITHENTSTEMLLVADQKRKRNREKIRQLLLMLTALFLFLLVLIGVLFVDQGYSATRPKRILMGFDVTGSTEFDQKGRAALARDLIWSLDYQDEFCLVLITDQTFSNPHIALNEKMPVKKGYFDDDLLRIKIDLIRKFEEIEKTFPKQRPATCLIEGVLLFSELLKGASDKDNILVIDSDMRHRCADFNLEHSVQRQLKNTMPPPGKEQISPDLSGVKVYIMGAATAGLDTMTWSKIRGFWQCYFKEAGALVMLYSINHQLKLPL